MRQYPKRKPFCPTVHPDVINGLYDDQMHLAEQVLDMEQRLRALEIQNNALADTRRATIYNQIEEKDKKKCQQKINLN